MAYPSLSTEAAQAPNYPYLRFNNRERKLLQSVKAYVDASAASAQAKIVYSGSFTTLGGDASETISVSGMLSTDRAFVVVHTAGATPRSIVAAAAANNQINVTMSDDPSTDHVLCYQVIRTV